MQALKKTELLENELNKLIALINSDGQLSMKELVKKIVELTDDVSHAVIPYWKKVCIKTDSNTISKLYMLHHINTFGFKYRA